MDTLPDNKPPQVFVFAPIYRCGSTLIQRILNTSDDLLIWGENGNLAGFLSTALAEIERQLRGGGEDQRRKFELGRPDLWSANMCPSHETVLKGVCSLFETLYSTHSGRWGFKEVRCGEREVLFLSNLFPDSRSFFVVRNPLEALSSYVNAGWTEESLEILAELWTERVEWFYRYSGDNPDRTLLIRYDEIALPFAEKILHFAGGSFDATRVSAVLSRKHGSAPRIRNLTRSQKALIEATCGECYRNTFHKTLSP